MHPIYDSTFNIIWGRINAIATVMYCTIGNMCTQLMLGVGNFYISDLFRRTKSQLLYHPITRPVNRLYVALRFFFSIIEDVR